MVVDLLVLRCKRFEYQLHPHFLNMKGDAGGGVTRKDQVTCRRRDGSLFHCHWFLHGDDGIGDSVECVLKLPFDAGQTVCLFLTVVFIVGDLTAFRPQLTAPKNEILAVFNSGDGSCTRDKCYFVVCHGFGWLTEVC